MKANKTLFISLPVSVLLLGLVAWSPPNNEDLIVGTTAITSPTGQVAVVGTGSSGKAKNSLVVGTGHTISASSGQSERSGSIVAGNANNTDSSASFIAGTNNQAVSGTSQEVRNSCLIGANNILTNAHGYIMGYNNQITGDYASAIGYGLQVGVPQGVALGCYNAPMSQDDTFVIGTGVDDANRFNALTITKDGDVLLGRAQGDISMGSYGGQ